MMPEDGMMSCPCGKGDYHLCNDCQYWFCSVHGRDSVTKQEALNRILAELAEAFPVETTVCLTHKRFIPCRSKVGCLLSTHPDDIIMVRKYQQS